MTTSDARKRAQEAAEARAALAGRDTEREALEDFLIDRRFDPAYDLSHVILESEWLTAHDAQVRADERKKISAAILTEGRDANDYGTQAGIAWVSGWQQATLAAARIARSGGAS